jgi:amidase
MITKSQPFAKTSLPQSALRMEAQLTQIRRVNPKANAIVTLLPEQARELFSAADETLARGGATELLHGPPIEQDEDLPLSGDRC